MTTGERGKVRELAAELVRMVERNDDMENVLNTLDAFVEQNDQ